MNPDPRPTIGRIVHYLNGPMASPMAAIVTMTPEEWSPGFRDAEGEWVATADVPQPKAQTVHLHVFAPFGHPWTPEQQELRDVSYGDVAGTWSWPPKV